MNPNFSYQEFTAGLKELDIPLSGSGNGTEAAKRLAFLLIWMKVQFGVRLGKWDLRLPMRFRVLIYLLALLIFLGLVLLPVFVPVGTWHNPAVPLTITLPKLPDQYIIAPDTLLHHVSLNQQCNDE
jgi:hypothetical protein